MQIYYCDQCGLRITDAEQKEGRAQIRAEGPIACANCLERQAPAKPPSGRAGVRRETAALPVRIPSTPTKASGSTPPERNTRMLERSPTAAKPSAGKNATMIVVILSALAVGLGTTVFLLLRSTPESAAPAPKTKVIDAPKVVDAPKNPDVPKSAFFTQPPTPTTTPTLNPAPTPPPVAPAPEARPVPRGLFAPKPDDNFDPRADVAASMLIQAQNYLKSNPDDLWAYKEKLEALKDRYGSTPAGKEAVKLLSEVKLPEPDASTNPVPPPETAWAKAQQIMPLVDPTKFKQSGNWSVENGVLRSDMGMWARIGLPYQVPEEYDLRLQLVRAQGDDCLLVLLARRGKSFVFSIGSGNMKVSFETIKESRRDSISTKSDRPNIFTNGKKHELIILVRSKSLRAYLDGKAIAGCQVNDDGLSLAPEFAMFKPNQLGFATWASVYEFHSLEVLPVTGAGTVLKD